MLKEIFICLYYGFLELVKRCKLLLFKFKLDLIEYLITKSPADSFFDRLETMYNKSKF